MKKTSKRRAAVTLAALLAGASLLLGGCTGGVGSGDASGTNNPTGTGAESRTASENETKHTPSGDTSPETLHAVDASGNGDKERLAYYEKLVAELQQSLLEEKSERYISDHAYSDRLDELEAQLTLLREAADKAASSDLPTSGEGQPTPVTERDTLPDGETSDTSEETGVPTVSFLYGVSGGKTTIHEYVGAGRTVAIPGRVGGAPVTSIADNAFRGKGVSVVVLPDTLTSIGWFAFCGCFGLESVTIPASVTSIAYGAFDGCPNLTILCPRDSYAAAWAESYGLRVQYV